MTRNRSCHSRFAGRIVGNEKLELKGKIENTAGKVQAAFGDAKADLKKAVHGK